MKKNTFNKKIVSSDIDKLESDLSKESGNSLDKDEQDDSAHSNNQKNHVMHFNKQGNHDATQINQSRRTQESRSDRETHIGGRNQSQSRRGSAGHTRG